MYLWLIDVDDPPDPRRPWRWLGHVSAADHLGDPASSIGANIRGFLAAQGSPVPPGARVVLLAQARAFGHCFDPISVFWVIDGGQVVTVVAEVHNTYGDRHAYVLHPDEQGQARTDKVLYVSPFYDTSGHYELSFTLCPQRVAVSVRLRREGAHHDFVAAFVGVPEAATRRTVLRAVARQPAVTWQISTLIRVHGIALWLRRLPVVPRPAARPQPGITGPDVARADGTRQAPRVVARRAAQIMVEYALRQVSVRAIYPDGRVVGAGGADAPTLLIHQPEAIFDRLARHPKLGLGEGYTADEWGAAPGTDLADALTPFAARLAEVIPAPLWRLRRLVDTALPDAHRNTRHGARANIAHHYDLSNELFATFLDETMTYSAALFGPEPDTQSLASAQRAKMDAILDLAHVGPGTDLLEIGSGWGALAIAAGQRGARVRSITLSAEQHAEARRRVEAAGLADRVSIEVCDYRDVTGRYDAIVSVEMLEAVGEEFWPTYLRLLRHRLRPGGVAAVQTITMSHERFLATRRSHGWIQEHIFPGGLIPSVAVIRDIGAHYAGLRVEVVRSLGASYAETLRRWRQHFMEHEDEVRRAGFGDSDFRRMWEFYLAYSEAGFRSGYLDDVHVRITAEEPCN